MTDAAQPAWKIESNRINRANKAEDDLLTWIATEDGAEEHQAESYSSEFIKARAAAETAARHFHMAAQIFLSQVRASGLNQDTIHDESEQMVFAALDMIEGELAPGVLELMRQAVESAAPSPLFDLAKDLVSA